MEQNRFNNHSDSENSNALSRRGIRRWICVGLAVLIVGWAIANWLAYRHAHAMMHYRESAQRTSSPERLSPWEKVRVLALGVQLPRPRTQAHASILGPDAISFTLESSEGIRLGAWYCPGQENMPVVLLFHGYGAEKASLVTEARTFVDLGLSVVLIDFRGSGDSSESYTTLGFDEAEDVVTALRHVHQMWPGRRTILYGQSMGAAAALRAVHSLDAHPDGLIVEAVFDEMLLTVRHRFDAMKLPSFPFAELLLFWAGQQAGFNAFQHNPVDYARAVPCPILFLHGALDPRAPVEGARRVHARVKAKSFFHEFPEIGHEPSVIRHPAIWRQSIEILLSAMDHPE
jgi:alpha-beta hydrolase superfamily lysophospholipase